MVVEILVTQHEAEQLLGDQPLHRMLDAPLTSVVREAGHQPPDQVKQAVSFAQQRGAAVGTDPLEIADCLAEGLKLKLRRSTVCGGKRSLPG